MASTSTFVNLNGWIQWRRQPKLFWGGQIFGGLKTFNFRRATVFCWGTPLLKAQNG